MIAKLDAACLGGGKRMQCVRSPIMCRPCSAAAASTVLLTTEKIRTLIDTIRDKKDRDT